MDILNTVIATVVSVKGVVEVRTANGLTKTVSAGDQLQANDTLITGAGAEVEIELINGQTLVFNEPTEVFLDESTYGGAEVGETEVDPGVLEQIQASLGDGVVDLAELEATAAGPQAGGAVGGGLGGFPVYGRDGLEGGTDAQGTPFGIGAGDIPEGEGAEEEGEGLLAEAPETAGLVPEAPSGGEEPGGGGEEPGGGGEEPVDLPHGISNVLMLFQAEDDVIAVKIDGYGGDVKDPGDPAQYIDQIGEEVDGEFIAYYIKAGSEHSGGDATGGFFDADGNNITDQVDDLGLSEYLNPNGNTFGGDGIDYSYDQGALEGSITGYSAEGEADTALPTVEYYDDFHFGEDSLSLGDLLDTDSDPAQLLNNYIEMAVQGNKVTLSIDSTGVSEGGAFEPDHVVEVSFTDSIASDVHGWDDATILNHLLHPADYDNVSGF
jgi:hypothetical protein